MNRSLRPIASALLLGAAMLTAPAAAAERLGSYGLEPAAAVAGSSSGGAMAVQLHVAHSATFSRGAAVIAGVPYDCARGSVLRASSRCMKALPAAPDDRESIRLTQARAKSGGIDTTATLSASRVYLFSGTRDTVVRPAVMEALYRYYRRYVDVAAILFDRDIPASHAWISPASSRACTAEGAPFINDCAIDVPGRLLAWLFGPLAPKSAPEFLRGRLLTFDQREFVEQGRPGEDGMDQTGFLFVPQVCTDAGAGCRLLVALHGCRQGRHFLGDTFVVKAGLNEWADANRIVVLYPQATVTPRSNPHGCWDWWGYSGDRYAEKDGLQIQTIKRMVDRLIGT